MKLDLIDDPWIDVHWCDGHNSKAGIMQCMENAGSISSVSIKDAVTKMDNIVPLVLMAMILERVVQPNHDAKLDMFEEGSLNDDEIRAIEEYISNCRNKGISFDIFDAERPFLQVPSKDAKNIFTKPDMVKPISVLEPFWPSGSNFFFHTWHYQPNIPPEVQHAMTPAQFAAALIRNHIFRTASGRGYTATGPVIGQPPLVVITNGRTLLETLLFMLPNAYTKGDLPIWERDTYVPDLQTITLNKSFGFLTAAISPVLYLRYGDFDQNGNVKNVYYTSAYAGVKKEKQPGPFATQYLQKGTCYLSRLVTIRDAKNKKIKKEVLRASDYSENTSPWLEMATSDVNNIGVLGEGLTSLPFIQDLKLEDIIDSQQVFSCTVYGLNLITQSVHNPAQSTMHINMKAEWLEPSVEAMICKFILYLHKVRNKLWGCLNNYQKELISYRDDSEIDNDSAVDEICRLFTETMNDESEHYFDMIAQNPTKETWEELTQQCTREALKLFDMYIPMRIDYLLRTKYRNRLAYILVKVSQEGLG